MGEERNNKAQGEETGQKTKQKNIPQMLPFTGENFPEDFSEKNSSDMSDVQKFLRRRASGIASLNKPTREISEFLLQQMHQDITVNRLVVSGKDEQGKPVYEMKEEFVAGEKIYGLLSAYRDKPFHELTRDINEAGHILAFCQAEGLTVDDLTMLKDHPQNPKSKSIHEKFEKARKRLIETACCDDPEESSRRTASFYADFLDNCVSELGGIFQQKTLTNDGLSKYLTITAYFQSVLVQTLRLGSSTPSECRTDIVEHVDQELERRGAAYKFTNVNGLGILGAYLSQQADHINDYIEDGSIGEKSIQRSLNDPFMASAIILKKTKALFCDSEKPFAEIVSEFDEAKGAELMSYITRHYARELEDDIFFNEICFDFYLSHMAEDFPPAERSQSPAEDLKQFTETAAVLSKECGEESLEKKLLGNLTARAGRFADVLANSPADRSARISAARNLQLAAGILVESFAGKEPLSELQTSVKSFAGMVFRAAEAQRSAAKNMPVPVTCGNVDISYEDALSITSQPANELCGVVIDHDRRTASAYYKYPESGLVELETANGNTGGKETILKEVKIRENINLFSQLLAKKLFDKSGDLNVQPMMDLGNYISDKGQFMGLCFREDDFRSEFVSHLNDFLNVPEDKAAQLKDFFNGYPEAADYVLRDMYEMAGSLASYQQRLNDPANMNDPSRMQVLKASYSDFLRRVDDLKELTAIDPAGEYRMLNYLECGSSASILASVMGAVNARRKEELLPPVEGRYHCDNFKSFGMSDEPEKGRYMAFDKHAYYTVNVKLGDDDHVITLETSAPPTGKLFDRNARGNSALGIFKTEKDVEKYHISRNLVGIPDLKAFESVAKIANQDKIRADSRIITGSEALRKAHNTELTSSPHSYETLAARLADHAVDSPYIRSKVQFRTMRRLFEAYGDPKKTEKEKDDLLKELHQKAEEYIAYKQPADTAGRKKLNTYERNRIQFAKDVSEFTAVQMNQKRRNASAEKENLTGKELLEQMVTDTAELAKQACEKKDGKSLTDCAAKLLYFHGVQEYLKRDDSGKYLDQLLSPRAIKNNTMGLSDCVRAYFAGKSYPDVAKDISDGKFVTKLVLTTLPSRRQENSPGKKAQTQPENDLQSKAQTKAGNDLQSNAPSQSELLH